MVPWGYVKPGGSFLDPWHERIFGPLDECAAKTSSAPIFPQGILESDVRFMYQGTRKGVPI